MIYAIGDIHGQCLRLKSLLNAIRGDAGERRIVRPRVVVLGDLIDRGPDSKGVIDVLLSAEFERDFDATILLGNHESWLLRALSGAGDSLNEWLHNGGAETIESYGVEFGGDSVDKVMTRFRASVPKTHVEFLKRLPLKLRRGAYFFAHAGASPSRPLDAQDRRDLLWIHAEFLNHEGDFGAVVVHGHSTTKSGQIEILANRIAVDTGCGGHGGLLSAVILGETGPVGSLAVDGRGVVHRDRMLDLAGHAPTGREGEDGVRPGSF
jgi:serine/threonine protein phosphatase 1